MDPDIAPSSTRIHQVTELAPSTLLEIAARLDQATSFADQIYRESEIDALWTLVDIQLRDAGLADDDVALDRWQSLHSRLWVAHDLIPDGRCAEAAVILRELAAAL